jgi:general secretion pathway protein M
MAMSNPTVAQWRQEFDERWTALAPRERLLVKIVAWALIVILVVMVGLRPAWRQLNETPVKLQAAETELEQMRRLAQEAQQLRQRPAVPPVQAEAALRAAVERLGSGARLNIQADRATVSFSVVSGAVLADWLQEVRGAARARVVEADVQSAGNAFNGSFVLALAVPPGGP